MTKININNHDEGKNTSPVEQEYFELLEKIKELREKKTGLNQHVIKIIEEEVQLVLGMFSNRLKALQYLNEKSLANKDYFRLLIELEEAEAKFEEVKKEYNKTHFETVIKKSGLSRVKHNYNDKQLLSLLIDSSVEEILSLIDTINEEELVLLEGGLTAKDINFNKKGKLEPRTTDGTKIIKLLNKYIFESYICERFVTNPVKEKEHLAKALSTDNMLDLLKIVGDVDDFVALRNETINKNVMLDFSGNIIGRNKEGNEFLGKLKKSLAQKAKHEYKQKVISNLDRRRNNIVDSINAKITESQQTHHEKVVSNNLDHPLVSLEDQMQILDKQHLNRKKQLVLENHIKIINESFERFSDNLAEVQSKLIRHSQKSFDKKTVLALIYELQEISNQFSSVLEIVENAPRLDLAQIESGIRPDNDLLIDIQTKITEEVDRIFNKRIEYIPEKVKKILINKKELERLTKNQQLQDEIKTRIIKILLENDDNFTNVEILKASLDYLFSLKEEAEVTKDNIILEAEEILQESHLHLFWKKIFEICDNSFSAQDKRQLKENFEIFKKSLKDSIGVHKQKMAEIKKYTSVDIIKEKKELEEAVLELEKIDREYSIWMNKLLLEIDWQHRKISDMEKDNIQKVNGLLVEEIRRSLN